MGEGRGKKKKGGGGKKSKDQKKVRLAGEPEEGYRNSRRSEEEWEKGRNENEQHEAAFLLLPQCSPPRKGGLRPANSEPYVPKCRAGKVRGEREEGKKKKKKEMDQTHVCLILTAIRPHHP